MNAIENSEKSLMAFYFMHISNIIDAYLGLFEEEVKTEDVLRLKSILENIESGINDYETDLNKYHYLFTKKEIELHKDIISINKKLLEKCKAELEK